MRVAKYEKEVETVLNRQLYVSVKDISEACGEMPMPSVYSRINKLLKEGKLSTIGKGKYISAPKLDYSLTVTPWMMEVNEYLVRTCEGINHCISEKAGNLYVQVYKSDMEIVSNALHKQYSKVLTIENINRFPLKLEGYIVLDRLVSESPLVDMDGVLVPSLEKKFVDCILENDEKPSIINLQKAIEAHPLNIDTMLRYAARRGVREEISALVSALDYSRVELMAKVQKYLATIPVKRAWVFGSFARCEETPSSDLDLLVDYMAGSRLSLLDIVKYRQTLESIIGREVDLIENGYLKSFAVPSSEKDKYLIYERKGE